MSPSLWGRDRCEATSIDTEHRERSSRLSYLDSAPQPVATECRMGNSCLSSDCSREGVNVSMGMVNQRSNQGATRRTRRCRLGQGWALHVLSILSPFSKLPVFNAPGLALPHPDSGSIRQSECQTSVAEDLQGLAALVNVIVRVFPSDFEGGAFRDRNYF